MTGKLAADFLWHMHQPLYKDPWSGEYYLPWVRLHSTFSYLDMIKVLDDLPGIKATFNLLATLVWQLKDLTDAKKIKDRYLDLTLKPADDLDEDDRKFILKNFFSALKKGDSPFLREYGRLFLKRGDELDDESLSEKANEFSVRSFRDIQVFLNLAWCGFTLRGKDPLCKELVNRFGGFTEKEKKRLVELQLGTVKNILPLYKKKHDEGQIELSITPYYHRILLLLLEKEPGANKAIDADKHVKKAIFQHERVFGRKPSGMWPVEGAICNEAIDVFASNNVKWIVSSESVFRKSLGETAEPYPFLSICKAKEKRKRIDTIFRNVALSNAISFNYASRSAEDAASDFMDRLLKMKRSQTRCNANLVPIILDGENPWPNYDEAGGKFLNVLYSRLSASEDIRTVSITEELKRNSERKELKKIHPGSWINADLSKWSGTENKGRAWTDLVKAKQAARGMEKGNALLEQETPISESSDWFWWYDDCESHMDLVFDELFRRHIKNIYKFAGKDVPDNLYEAFEKKEERSYCPSHFSESKVKRPLKVVFLTSECVPFAKTGGLADVSGSLPKALFDRGIDVRVVMPFYEKHMGGRQDINLEASKVKGSFTGDFFGFKLYSTYNDGVKTYFISKKKYFGRKGLYGEKGRDYFDNAYRFSYFQRAVLDMLKFIGFFPDIFHCNDWQTALLPFYFLNKGKNFFPEKRARTLYTIHNMAYQGVFSRKVLGKCRIPPKFFNMHELEIYGKVNFMKGGIVYSDAVSTVSKKYAQEIMTPDYGAGLEDVIRVRKSSLYGILNGADYSLWSPGNDPKIKKNYSASTLEDKKICKKDLINVCGFKMSAEEPIIGSVGRLAEQKGIDLLFGIAGDLVSGGFRIVILGSGDEEYNRALKRLSEKYPDHIFARTAFDDELAHKIEAGADMFIMPSRFEPCGLNQIYSIRYGTIPVVRNTGGLGDVITDYDQNREMSNGFVFDKAEEKDLFGALIRALRVFGDKKKWKKLMIRAMKMDFSWSRSAAEYEQLYRKLLE